MDRSNGNPCVIVAIPSRTDDVWKVSSEKVPHLTILALDSKEVIGSKANRIAEYLEHVANTSLRPFTLFANDRDTLGDDDADVLFFAKDYSIRELANARAHLLKNPDIARAYSTFPQFPSWLPHLTLGYPGSPAKIDLKDRAGVSWVEFDRVALWTGDYEGPEFKLKSNEKEVTMSNNTDDILAHFGVKGMRWGVRRSQAELDSASEDASSAKATAEKIKANRGKTQSLSNKELQDFITRANLEQQYSRLTKDRGKLEKGQKHVKTVIGLTRTAQDAYNIANSPLMKDIRKAIVSS